MIIPVFIYKRLIGYRPIMYTPLWWWFRLMCHEGFRFDDYHIWGSFWTSLSGGWDHMQYVHKFEEFWGEGSYPPERIVLPKENFDSLVERLNKPPDPEAMEKIKRVLERKAPWDD